jgi:hypothetical protein
MVKRPIENWLWDFSDFIKKLPKKSNQPEDAKLKKAYLQSRRLNKTSGRCSSRKTPAVSGERKISGLTGPEHSATSRLPAMIEVEDSTK